MPRFFVNKEDINGEHAFINGADAVHIGLREVIYT